MEEKIIVRHCELRLLLPRAIINRGLIDMYAYQKEVLDDGLHGFHAPDESQAEWLRVLGIHLIMLALALGINFYYEDWFPYPLLVHCSFNLLKRLVRKCQ